MRFGILGPCSLELADRRVRVTRRRERCLLGVLLLARNRPVLAQRLLGLLWDDEPPGGALRSLHSHMARLRRVLAPADGVSLRADGPAYVLTVPPDSVDAERFRVTVAEAAGADTAERARLLRSALELWRGPLLAGDASPALRSRLGAELIELRSRARLDWLSAEVSLGRVAEALPELARLTGDRPAAEDLAALHMRVLAGEGRRAEALEVYERCRAALAEEFGLDPGSTLRELHRSILRGNRPPAPRPAPDASPPVPRQLPPSPTGFTGRTAELAALDELTDPGRLAAGPALAILSGAGGAGKTALALHWAHRAAHSFPDGTLHLELRGHSGRRPVRPQTALARLLRALGVPPERVPGDTDEAAALYRSTIAGRRVLLLLDDAASAEQVRPLLPAHPGSLTLVTGRSPLTGLTVREGGEHLGVGMLAEDEARALLADMIGAARLTAEPQAATALVTACAGLPLALRITAAHLARHPGRALAEQARALTGPDRWAQLTVEGDGSVRAAFERSHRALTAADRKLFALLALPPAPGFTTDAVAVLGGETRARTLAALETLADAHLVHRTGPDRWGLHDLLRDFAAELAGEDTAHFGRLFDWYLRTAHAAMELVDPDPARAPVGERPEHPRDRQPDPAPPFTDRATALAWLETEREGLLELTRRGAERGHEPTWRLPRLLWRFHLLRGHLSDWVEGHEAVLPLAAASRDRTAEQAIGVSLGNAYGMTGRPADAEACHRRVLDIAGSEGDRRLAALAAADLSHGHRRAGRLTEARSLLEPAIEALRACGDRLNEAGNLTDLGRLDGLLGRHRDAIAHQLRALELGRSIPAPIIEALANAGLGRAHTDLGEHSVAIGHLRTALGLYRRLGDLTGEATTSGLLGLVHARAGRQAEALDHRDRALAIGRRHGPASLSAAVCNDAGETSALLGEATTALALHTEALGNAGDVPWQRARAHHGMADALASLGREAEAAAHVRAAAELRRAMDGG
ncbi:BTAD domain-containing putative transcriptional regulator [Phytomonospora sp. NPDC050363]|uniref:AfsR/SARP family transcriptional regulator n=1 Tax=Phytomonospora sp. NPDC050363 TaxID=3155642 RepID=UPI0033C868DD